jgi:hypothetical protein
MSKNYIEQDLLTTLSKDERLLWTGRPRVGIIFRSSDIFLIPFSLLWFGFAIFWEYNVVKIGVPLFALFGLPFIIMGIYISVGRFFLDNIRRKNTMYGITDNRVIIKSGLFSKDIKSLNIRTISDITFKEKTDGSGTISFGPSDLRYTLFSGMGYWPGLKLPPSIELIDEVGKVYKLLIEQQNKL